MLVPSRIPTTEMAEINNYSSNDNFTHFSEMRSELYKCGFASERGGEPLSEIYNLWAGKIDQILLANGYQAPCNLAALASEFLPEKSSRILDAASGTGLVGKELKSLGYFCIDALDPSQNSLDESKKYQCYREYICDTLNQHQTKIPDDHYDAVVMCGAFGIPGHVTASCFPELLRVTKSGGYIMFTMAENVLEGCLSQTDEAISDFSRQSRWELLEDRWIQYIACPAFKEQARVPLLKVSPK